MKKLLLFLLAINNHIYPGDFRELAMNEIADRSEILRAEVTEHVDMLWQQRFDIPTSPKKTFEKMSELRVYASRKGTRITINIGDIHEICCDASAFGTNTVGRRSVDNFYFATPKLAKICNHQHNTNLYEIVHKMAERLTDESEELPIGSFLIAQNERGSINDYQTGKAAMLILEHYFMRHFSDGERGNPLLSSLDEIPELDQLPINCDILSREKAQDILECLKKGDLLSKLDPRKIATLEYYALHKPASDSVQDGIQYYSDQWQKMVGENTSSHTTEISHTPFCVQQSGFDGLALDELMFKESLRRTKITKNALAFYNETLNLPRS